MPRQRRSIPEINAGSMADIAFLLLIFFLVTTSIIDEKGLSVKLPALPKAQQSPPIVQKRNVYEVYINDQNQFMVQGQVQTLTALQQQVIQFIDNPHHDPNMSASPQEAVLLIHTDAKASYGQYIALQNGLKTVYQTLREQYSKTTFDKHYNDLPNASAERLKIDQVYPMNIAESDLTNP